MALSVGGFYFKELSPSYSPAPGIDVFSNIWSDPEKTINSIENECSSPLSGITWEKARTVGFHMRHMRTNYHLRITDAAENGNDVASEINNRFKQILVGATIPYGQRYLIHDEYWHEGYSMLRYSGGQKYDAHYDAAGMPTRFVSAILYLNENFEGGEIEFPHLNIKIKPQSGMLVVFPSNYIYTHIAHPVTSGTKYALVTWIHNRPI